MRPRRLLAACLPRPLKQALKRLICGAPGPLPPDAPPRAAFRARLALAPAMTMELVPGDIISDAIATTGVWEEELSQRLLALAHSGGTMIEVGANIGYFTLLWAAQNDACRVLAFEPALRNLTILERNVRNNGLSQRVDLLPLAIGRELGIARFDPGPSEQTGWGGLVRDERPGTFAVAMAPLDDLLPPDERYAVLKIDVEGADTWVLEGCRRLLAERRVAHVFFEQNFPRMAALGIEPQAAAAFLAEVGYTARPITPADQPVVEWEASPR